MISISKKLLLLLLMVTAHTICFAQFSPPGLGDANTAEWFAIGLKQNLNKPKTTTSATFFGLGRTSTQDDYNPSDRAAIYVVNQEITHRFSKHWEYAGAVSYRWQNKYKETNPYIFDTPSAKQEVRFYGKYSYVTSINKTAISLTARPEYRLFFNPDFTTYNEHYQFRLRLRGKVKINLNKAETQKIITSEEFLFASSKHDHWNQFKYTDSRFCLYYSYALPKQKTTFNIGYMNDIIGKSHSKIVHYIALDLTFKNLFHI